MWAENGITFTNNKGSSTSNVGDYAKPARLYKSSQAIVACSLGNITQIIFDCNTNAYATELKNSISGSTVSADKVTVTCDGSSNEFTISKLSGQVRLDALTVSYTPSTSGGEESTPTQLTTPANLKESSITETSATLSWDAVANASNYSVTINGKNATATTNSYSATGLTAGTEYTWSVVAKGDGTNYTDSEAAQHTFTTTAATTPEEPGTGGEETWTLVTNASDLKAGDEVVITSKDADYALSTNQKSSNRAGVAITKSGNTITIGNDVQILTIEATGDATVPFALNTGAGYLYAASSSGNQLKTKTTLDAHGKWAISIASGVASIIATNSSNRNVMQYNYNGGSPLFACYASASQTALAIYKKVTSSGSGSGETVVLLIPKNGCFEEVLLVQLLALFLQQKDSSSATLQVPPCTRW